MEPDLFEARELYAIITLAIFGSVALDFTPFDPTKALFISGVNKGRTSVAIATVAGYSTDFQRRSR